MTAAVHYCDSHKVKLLLIADLQPGLTYQLDRDVLGKSVVPIACGGDTEPVSSSVGHFQSQKESAAMTALLVPIFSLVCTQLGACTWQYQ